MITGYYSVKKLQFKLKMTNFENCNILISLNKRKLFQNTGDRKKKIEILKGKR